MMEVFSTINAQRKARIDENKRYGNERNRVSGRRERIIEKEESGDVDGRRGG